MHEDIEGYVVIEGLPDDIRVTVEQDEYPTSPREWDNATVFLLNHGSYILPWEDDDAPKDATLDELEAWVRETYDDVLYVGRVRGYDHSLFTISLSTSYPYDCPWDSGWVGLVYVRASNACGTPVEHAAVVAEQDIETFNQYLVGDVWYYRIEKRVDLFDKDGTPRGHAWDLIDSCGGFYGHEAARDEAHGAALAYLANGVTT